MKKYLILVTVLFFVGCSECSQVQDVNSSSAQSSPQFKTIKPEVVCDTRGYAYYEFDVKGENVLTPILENANSTEYFHQVKCEELKGML